MNLWKSSAAGHEKFHQMAEATQVIAELVDDAFLDRHEADGSLNEAVRLMCAALEDKDLISEPKSLEQGLLSRMELGGIGIPETTLALFHARDGSVTPAVVFRTRVRRASGTRGSGRRVDASPPEPADGCASIACLR